MAIGTDTYPHNMAEEMRLALFTAKLARGHVDYTHTADVFNAATLGGAKALGRTDIGRIAEGAAADLVLVDLAHPAMQPCRDPLRSFIFSARDRAVRDVFVAGRQVVADGRCLTIDVESALADLERGHAQAMQDVPSRDWAKRAAEEISPLSLKVL
jgi:cytosine/adenosine deaminase-related metal-dependent hydrolase